MAIRPETDTIHYRSAIGVKSMSVCLVLLACLLCLGHVVLTPWFCLKVKSYGRFLISYIAFTAGIGVTSLLLLWCQPEDTSIHLSYFGFLLFIPFFSVAPLAILVRTFGYLSERSRHAQTAPVQQAPGSTQGNEWQPAFVQSHATSLPSTPYVVTSSGSKNDNTLRKNALLDVLKIVGITLVILATCPNLSAIPIEVTRMLFPVHSASPGIPESSSAFLVSEIRGIVVVMIMNIIAGELMWQYWTRKISKVGERLYERPIRYHLLTLSLIGILPAFGIIYAYLMNPQMLGLIWFF